MLIKTTTKDNLTYYHYKYPIMAGMKFNNGKTTNNKIHKVGYYIFQITTNNIGETISEKVLERKIF